MKIISQEIQIPGELHNHNNKAKKNELSRKQITEQWRLSQDPETSCN